MVRVRQEIQAERFTRNDAWRIIEQQAQLLEDRCVTFADGLLYQDLLEKDTK